MSDYPSPTLSVEYALKQFGGWSRYFRMSGPTYDEKHIYWRQTEVGFWQQFYNVRVLDQLREEVIICYHEFKRLNPTDQRRKEEVCDLLAKALLKEGWKPVKKPILDEIKSHKRKAKEELSWLKKERKRLRVLRKRR